MLTVSRVAWYPPPPPPHYTLLLAHPRPQGTLLCSFIAVGPATSTTIFASATSAGFTRSTGDGILSLWSVWWRRQWTSGVESRIQGLHGQVPGWQASMIAVYLHCGPWDPF